MVAAMTRTGHSLITVLSAWPDHPDAGRPAPAWTNHQVLGAFATPAQAVLAARGHDGDRVLAALAARRHDPAATTAALAALAPRLGLISGCWKRSGLSGADLADAESDLVTECLAGLRANPHRTAVMVVQTAWHRVHGRRRTTRARAARLVAIDHDHFRQAGAPDPGPLHQLQELLAEGLRDGTVSRLEAQSVWAAATGWTTPEACAAIGCSAPAWRARRSRAIRALAATAGEVA
jgi:hypothetical protein